MYFVEFIVINTGSYKARITLMNRSIISYLLPKELKNQSRNIIDAIRLLVSFCKSSAALLASSHCRSINEGACYSTAYLIVLIANQRNRASPHWFHMDI